MQMSLYLISNSSLSVPGQHRQLRLGLLRPDDVHPGELQLGDGEDEEQRHEGQEGQDLHPQQRLGGGGQSTHTTTTVLQQQQQQALLTTAVQAPSSRASCQVRIVTSEPFPAIIKTRSTRSVT